MLNQALRVPSLKSRLVLLLAGVFVVLLATSASAQADYTHLWEYDFSVSEGSQPEAVDGEGNVYLYDDVQHAVLRVDPHGDPVEFSALGTNAIDGHGDDDCVVTPESCDQVPTNALDGHTASIFGGDPNNALLAVDNSGGVTDGYIYVMNILGKPEPGRVEVFAPSGRFLGELDPTLIGPENCIQHTLTECESMGISVDSDGHIYIFTRQGLGIDHVDQYAPVDGFPGNDVFAGQIRVAVAVDPPPLVPQQILAGAAGAKYTYLGGSGHEDGPSWRKYDASEYHRLSGYGVPTDPDVGASPFVNGGKASGESVSAAMDSRTEQVYTFGASNDVIREYGPEDKLVGPPFGLGKVDPRARVMAIDPSPGPGGGRLYIHGASAGTVAVFGPPVPIPNVSYHAPLSVLHESAQLSGAVDLNGGGEVTDCKIEYGFTTNYEASIPCDQPVPYAIAKDVSGELSGLYPGTEYHYRISASNANGTTYGTDQVISTQAVLAVETLPATAITTGTALLHGSLDADGLATEYHFEYGLSTLYGRRTADASAGNASGVVDLPAQEIDELQSGRTYHYRLVASNELGSTKGEDKTFTVASKPAIGGIEARNVTATAAELRAGIDPGGYETSFHFDYGTTVNYGSRIPAVDGELPAGYGNQTATAQLTGLEPNVTYHYRVVTENEWGSVVGEDATFSFNPPNCPNSYIRQETSANALPDCRAYEIVSPEAAGGLQLFAGNGVPDPLATQEGVPYRNLPQNSGEAVRPARFAFYGAFGAASGTNPPNSTVDLYVTTRSDTGWHTAYPGLPGDQALLVAGPQCSASLDRCYDFHLRDLFKKDPSDKGSAVPYLWDANGGYRGRLPTNASVVPNSDNFIGSSRPSPDFSHFVFSSLNVPFASGGVVGAPGSVYDNDVAANSVRVASLLPSGDPIPQFGGGSNEVLTVPAVSNDGSHILMAARGGVAGSVRLFMRADHAVSYDVSRGHDVKLVGMSADGSEVVFSSPERVTGDDHDDAADLFAWSENGDSVTRISQGNGAGDSNECATQWEGFSCGAVAVSTKASTDDLVSAGDGAVFFYSPENLDPTRPAVGGERNLYLYRDHQVHYVTTLESAGEVSRLQISPDGAHAAFLTDSKLPGYENAGHDEMYSYNAEAETLKCVSCIPSSAPPHSDVTASASGRFMADDGRAFFSTGDALVARDTNGLRDVYEFVGGRPQLISAGTGPQDSTGGTGIAIFPLSVAGLESVSHDGVDVFFSTFDSLVPQDRNGQFLKFYDARTNGGFHFDPPPLPCTAADECHGAGSSTPTAPAVGSGAQLGAGGNATSASGRYGKKAAKKAKGKHRHAQRHRKGRAKK